MTEVRNVRRAPSLLPLQVFEDFEGLAMADPDTASELYDEFVEHHEGDLDLNDTVRRELPSLKRTVEKGFAKREADATKQPSPTPTPRRSNRVKTKTKASTVPDPTPTPRRSNRAKTKASTAPDPTPRRSTRNKKNQG